MIPIQKSRSEHGHKSESDVDLAVFVAWVRINEYFRVPGFPWLMRCFSWHPLGSILLGVVRECFSRCQEGFFWSWFAFGGRWVARLWEVSRTREGGWLLRKCSCWRGPEWNSLCNWVQCRVPLWRFHSLLPQYRPNLQSSFAYYPTFTSLKDL